ERGRAAVVPVPVRQLANVPNVEHREVGPKAGRELSDLLRQGEGRRTVYGGGDDRFRGAQVQLAYPKRKDERQAWGRRRTRIEVSSEADRHAGVDESPCGRVLRLAQEKHGARKQRGHRVRPRERGDAAVRNRRQVIGRRRVERSGELRAAGRRELVRVQLEQETRIPRRTKNDTALIDGVNAGLAKHVGEARQTLRGDGGNHLVHEQIDV